MNCVATKVKKNSDIRKKTWNFPLFLTNLKGEIFMRSFIFSNRFILVRDLVDPSQGTAHTFTHSFTPRDNLA